MKKLSIVLSLFSFALLSASCDTESLGTAEQMICRAGEMCCPSPIVVDLQGDGIHLTPVKEGVTFDLKPKDARKRIYSWTEKGSDDAWLALDRNGNGTIDDGTELFGNMTFQDPMEGEKKNGFVALRLLDENHDGVVDEADPRFADVRFWQDLDHDGFSQPNELLTPSKAGVAGLSVQYSEEAAFNDENGNYFGYRASVIPASGSPVGSVAWDVFMAYEKSNSSAVARVKPDISGWACNVECATQRKLGAPAAYTCPLRLNWQWSELVGLPTAQEACSYAKIAVWAAAPADVQTYCERSFHPGADPYGAPDCKCVCFQMSQPTGGGGDGGPDCG